MDQEFASDVPGEAVVDNRPLSERIGDKNWKTRLTAYEDLKREIKSTLGEDPIFSEYVSWVPKMIADANASALDGGLDTAFAFTELAPEGMLRPYYEKIVSNIVEKTFGARPGTQQRGKNLIVKLIELDEPSVITTALLSKLGDKKPKVPPTCLEIVKEGISLFGARAFPIKEILASMGPVLNGSNGPARELALAIMVDLTRWIGKAPFHTLLENIRSAQKTEFERMVSEMEAQGLGAPRPTLYLRKDRPKPGQEEVASAVSATSSSSSSSSGKAGGSMDSREFIEEIDLQKRLKTTDFATLIAEDKWAEQLRGLQLVIDILGPTPKVKSGCEIIGDIVHACKGFLRQGHLQVQLSALKIFALLSDGLRSEFSAHFRSNLSLIISKCKEKRLVTEVQTCLLNGLLYCTSMDSYLEEVVELIKNKKNPPHARICGIEFVISAVSQAAEKIGNDCVKPLTEAFISSCEDSDPKVREADVNGLVAFAQLIRTRGRVVLDAHKLIQGLETSAPRVFKKIQTMNDAPAGGAATATSTTSAPSTAVAANNTTSGASSASSGVAKRPGTTASTSATSTTASTSSLPKRPTAGTGSSSSAAPKKSSKEGSSKTGGNQDEDGAEVEELAMSPEDAQTCLADLGIDGWDTSFQGLMASAKWQDKVDALTALGNAITTSRSGARHSAPLIVYLAAKTSNFKISNINILKAVIQTAVQCAESLDDSPGQKFSRPAAWELIKNFGDKLSDKKTAELVGSLLTALAKSLSVTFVVRRLAAVMDKVKAPVAHQAFMEWVRDAIKEFGAGSVPIPYVNSLCQMEMDNKISSVRTAAVEVLGQLYHQVGPRLQGVVFTDDMKPQLKSLIEAEFTKIGYDPTAASKFGNSSAGASGSGSGSSGSSGGLIPRQDLSSLLDKNIVSEMSLIDGKTSWQSRKAAMEAVLQACERSGHYLDASSKNSQEIIKALKPRLNDTQANLKPLAALTLGHILASLEHDAAGRFLRPLAGPMIAGIADNKKNMRDAAITALQLTVTLNKSPLGVGATAASADPLNGGGLVYPLPDCSTGEPNLLVLLVPPSAEALVNPMGRAELISFLQSHVESFRGDLSELVAALILCMQDKTAAVRVAAETLLATLASRSLVSKASIDKATRDLAPATKRTLQPAVDKIMLGYGTKKVGGGPVDGTAPLPTASAEPIIQSSAQVPASSNTTSSSVSRIGGIPRPTIPSASASSSSLPSAPVVSQSSIAGVSSSMAAANNSAAPPQAPGDGDRWLLRRTSKARRLEEFYKTNWPMPPEDVSPHEMGVLRGLWEPLMTPDLAAAIFVENKAGSGMSLHQDQFVSGIQELMTQFDCPMILQHADLILRFAAFVLCQRETANGLLKVLQLVTDLFGVIKRDNTTLHESEMITILPHLIDRSGHKSERHKNMFKTCLLASVEVCSSQTKLTQLLFQGLLSKNKKSRVCSIEILQHIVESQGFAVLGKTGFKDLGAFLDNKDNDITGRHACLELCFALFVSLGSDISKLIRLMGDLSERSQAMVQDRIKQKTKLSQQGAPGAPVPPVASSTTNAATLNAANIAPVQPAAASTATNLAINTTEYHSEVGSPETNDSEAIPFKLVMTPPAGLRKANSALRQAAMQQVKSSLISLDEESSLGREVRGDSVLTRNTMMNAGGSSYLGQSTAAATNVPSAVIEPAPITTASTSSRANSSHGSIFSEMRSRFESYLTEARQRDVSETEALYEETMDYLKVFHEMLKSSSTSSTSTLASFNEVVEASDSLLSSLAEIMRISFQRPAIRRSQSKYANLSFDASLLTASVSSLFQAFRRSEVVSALSATTMHSLLMSCFESLVKLLEIQQVIRHGGWEVLDNLQRALNMSLLSLTALPIAKDNITIQLLDLLLSAVKSHNSQGLGKPIMRLLEHILSQEKTRTQSGGAFRGWHDRAVLSKLNQFFSDLPFDIQDDRPFRIAKTLLHELIVSRSSRVIFDLLDEALVAKSSFLYKLTLKLSGVDSEASNSINSVGNMGMIGSSSISSALAASDVPLEVRSRLVSLIDAIPQSNNKIQTIRQIHEIVRDHKEIQIEDYLRSLSTAFRKFVLDQLSRLDMETKDIDKRPMLRSESSEVTRDSFMLSSTSASSSSLLTSSSNISSSNSTSSGSEALRILETLKNNNPRNSIYLGSGSSSSSSSSSGSMSLANPSLSMNMPSSSMSSTSSNNNENIDNGSSSDTGISPRSFPRSPFNNSNRNLIQDKVRGSLMQITQTLDTVGTAMTSTGSTGGNMSNSGSMGMSSSLSSSADGMDSDLMMRLNRLRNKQ